MALFDICYLTLNDIMTLKSGLEVTQDHLNRYHLQGWVQFPIRLPCMTLSCIICEIEPDIRRKSYFSYPLAFDVPFRGRGTQGRI